MRRYGSGVPPLHRCRLGLEFAVSGRRDLEGMIDHHAHMARTLPEQFGLPEAVLEALGAAYEHWDGRGWPGRVPDKDVPVAGRLAQLAEFVEVAHRVGGVEGAKELARSRVGRQFDSAPAELIRRDGASILDGLDAVETWDAVVGAEPALAVVLSGDRFDASARELHRPQVAVLPRPRARIGRPRGRGTARAGHGSG